MKNMIIWQALPVTIPRAVCRGDEYLVRGFETENILVNGNRTASASTLDTANVERIEALRGPTAVMFGKADPGGLINVITKQSLSETYRQVSIRSAKGFADEGDRLALAQVSGDFSGPITDDKTLLYRFNFATEYEEGFRQDYDERLLFLSSGV